MNNNTGKIYCPEVSYVRIICIFMLVCSHAFSPYGGDWEYFYNDEPIVAYKWIHLLAYSFMLPAFVFISGYLFSMQMGTNPVSFKTLFVKKFKRLYLPALIFGVLYFILFRDFTNLFDAIRSIAVGIGHLWFLPMLFQCFLFTFFLHKIKGHDIEKLLALFLLALISKLGYLYPIQGGKLMFYLFFFYLGFELFKIRERIWGKNSKELVGALFVLFITSFVILTPLVELKENTPPQL